MTEYFAGLARDRSGRRKVDPAVAAARAAAISERDARLRDASSGTRRRWRPRPQAIVFRGAARGSGAGGVRSRSSTTELRVVLPRVPGARPAHQQLKQGDGAAGAVRRPAAHHERCAPPGAARLHGLRPGRSR